jgi:hypothetical protein
MTEYIQEKEDHGWFFSKSSLFPGHVDLKNVEIVGMVET